MKGNEYVDLAFNSRMTPVYNLNDIDNIVRSMTSHSVRLVSNNRVFNASLLAIRFLLVLPLALLIFLFISSIFFFSVK